ncbi:MAG: hypothetical protein CW338_06735 [Clostridiales bacterium]|nr:hypothetical protein [Clostridiales bacterium]
MIDTDQKMNIWGTLPVENAFITDYLPGAKGDFVRVYLYALYHSLYLRTEWDTVLAASNLGMEPGDIEAAMRYWERRGLITKISEEPLRYEIHSANQVKQKGRETMGVDEEYVEFAENVYSLFGTRRKVSASEIALAYEWVADIGLPAETVLMLISHMISTRGVNFKFRLAELVAQNMKNENVLSPEDADLFFRREQEIREGTKAVLRHLGKRREPSEDEMNLYQKWVMEWKFDREAVLNACSETTRAGDPTFAYLDGILSRLSGKEARTGKAVSRQMADEKQKKKDMRAVLSLLHVDVAEGVFEPFYDAMRALYPQEVVELAAAECAAHTRGREARVEKTQELLQAWSQRGLKDEKDVRAYLAEVGEKNKLLRQLFEKMDYAGNPTAADREMLSSWRAMGFDDEILMYAAEQSRTANGSKLRYMDRVLTSWHEDSIRTAAEARSRVKTAPAGRQDAGKPKVISGKDYTQRQYTDEEIERAANRAWEEALKEDE